MLRKAIICIATLMVAVVLPMQADNVESRLRRIGDSIQLAREQHDDVKQAKFLTGRAVFMYNNALVDSVLAYVPNDLKTLAALGEWDRYYETWTYLVNTYIYYTNSKNTALREVKTMFDDAMKRDNQYGMGIAYYTMGNVYLNMNNLDESAASYQKGLDILLKLKPLPLVIQELYSYCGDVLNEQHKYNELQQLTVGWKDYLERCIPENKIDKDNQRVMSFYYDIARIQADLGLNKLDEAEQLLIESKDLVVTEDSYEANSWYTCMAQLRLQQGRYAEALQLNDRRMRMISPDEDKAIYLNVASQRGEILMHLGRYEESARLYKNMYAQKDSINSADTKNQLNEMNTLFQVDELKMEQERAQFRNTLIIAGLIFLALITFTIFRIIAARRLKKAHDKLQETHEELLTAYDQLEETTAAKERIESDLRIARNIQMGMVPRNFPERPDLDLYASMTPAKAVGGDLYGYYLTGDKLYIALGDVSGKGVPASLFMAQATRLFRTLAAQEMMPDEICTRINDALSGEDNETCMFVTMYIGLIDLTTGHLDFCNAGHNPPVLLHDGQADFIEMIPNAPIGLFPGLEYEGEEISDITNCPLFVYTDGLNEAENREKKQFGDDRLHELLLQTPFESCQQTVEMLHNAVETYRDGAEPNDDLTMLCVKVLRS